MKVLKYLPVILLASSAIHAAPKATAIAATQGITTQIMMPTEIASAHRITISNDTPGAKMFYWTITLCPDTQPERCISQKNQLGLTQGQHWTHDYQLRESIVFRAVGSKSISAKTEITGAAYSVHYDQKYVDVHY